tara:strand:+ start:1246 stop:1632 length:387 start_codon:yes stop_codon:yes gene_type:complete
MSCNNNTQYTQQTRNHIKQIINKVGGIFLNDISDEKIDDKINETFNKINNNEKKIIIASLIMIEEKLTEDSSDNIPISPNKLFDFVQNIFTNQLNIFQLILPSNNNNDNNDNTSDLPLNDNHEEHSCH